MDIRPATHVFHRFDIANETRASREYFLQNWIKFGDFVCALVSAFGNGQTLSCVQVELCGHHGKVKLQA
jgi:hypothetical protein